MRISDHHKQRMRFLRRLSMTCRAMWLRFVPWVWERLELPFADYWSSGETFAKKLNAITNALHAEPFLATTMRYLCTLPCPWVGADSRPVKVHEGSSLGEWVYLSFVRQMLRGPPKSPYTRDGVGDSLRYDLASERA